MCQCRINYSPNQMKLVDKSTSIQRKISCEKWRFYQQKIEDEINYKRKDFIDEFNSDTSVYKAICEARKNSFEFGNGFLGTKLGEGQLGCAEELMLG